MFSSFLRDSAASQPFRDANPLLDWAGWRVDGKIMAEQLDCVPGHDSI